MSREIKVFEVSVAADLEPYPFKVKMTRESDGETREHLFHATAEPGAGVLLAAGTLVRYNDAGQPVADVAALLRFFNQALPDDEFVEFKAMVDDKEWTIDIGQLMAIMQWLMETYGGRPTESSPASSGGRRHTGQNLTAISSPKAATSTG